MRTVTRKFLKGLASTLAFVVCSHSAFATTVKSTAPADVSAKVDAFIQKMVNQHQFDEAYLSGLLKRAEPNKKILEAITRPWEAKPWHQYHPIFLTEKRTQKGAEFWVKHEKTLQQAQKELGVPAEIIVAILGVESFFGTYKGKYNVLDALFTLGFYHPPRSKFFKKELEEFFILARDEQLPLEDIMGSYAGAMGWGQFISSSYRHYAIDFDGDGIRDLLNNPVDAIGSVANYFKRNGWQTGEPIAFPAKISDNTDINKLISKSLKFKHHWQELQTQGVKLADGNQVPSEHEKVKLLEFKQKSAKEYWVGLHNFYVITRYNHSPLYAMAVYQLSQNIKARKAAL